jgi:hypothetical protein
MNPSETAPYSRQNRLAAARQRRWRRWALLGLLALAVVAGRVLHDSWSAFAAGGAAEARGDRVQAVRQYLHATRMYLPGSPFVPRALDRLEAMAAAARAAGEAQIERQALEAVRAGLLGARSLYTPHAPRLAAADRRLAELYAAIEDPAVDPGATPAQRQAWHRDRLAVRPGPAVPATVAALVGLALWLGAAVMFLRRGVDRTLRLERPWALASGIGFFVGFALFVVGLRFA